MRVSGFNNIEGTTKEHKVGLKKLKGSSDLVNNHEDDVYTRSPKDKISFESHESEHGNNEIVVRLVEQRTNKQDPDSLTPKSKAIKGYGDTAPRVLGLYQSLVSFRAKVLAKRITDISVSPQMAKRLVDIICVESQVDDGLVALVNDPEVNSVHHKLSWIPSQLFSADKKMVLQKIKNLYA